MNVDKPDTMSSTIKSLMDHYIGQRLSYQGDRCTVRYVGTIREKKGQWLGVEWDDALKGKHDGFFEGYRYFTCLASSTTAASFIRPNRPADPTSTLTEAMRDKYGRPSGVVPIDTIHISGKAVQEIGFDLIEQQLADLKGLKIVILDRLNIKGGHNDSTPAEKQMKPGATLDQTLSWLASTKIEELRLSENLLESWNYILEICRSLRRLRILDISSNRFRNKFVNLDDLMIPHIQELDISNTLLAADGIPSLISAFPRLKTLTASQNAIKSIPSSLSHNSLSHIDLSYNNITSLPALAPLASLTTLTQLSLRGNPIGDLADTSLTFPSVTSLDLSDTQLPTFLSLNPLPQIFPALTRLLTQNTPLSSLPSSHLLTIARLSTLTELNYAPITPAERTNAELYYLSQIALQISSEARSPDHEREVLDMQHPRWDELCRIHSEPDVHRKYLQSDEQGGGQKAQEYAQGSLGARVAKILFIFPRSRKEESSQQKQYLERTRLIPLTTSIYTLLGLVARLYSLPYLSIRLVLETDEYDPIAEDEDDWNDQSEVEGMGEEGTQDKKDGRWIRREEPLLGTTKPIGDWISEEYAGMAKEVKIRVEIND